MSSAALRVAAIIALAAGVADADVPNANEWRHTIGTIQSIDRQAHVVTMAEGLRLRADHPELLEGLNVGDVVTIDFARAGGGWVMRTIQSADADVPTDTDE